MDVLIIIALIVAAVILFLVELFVIRVSQLPAWLRLAMLKSMGIS